MPWLLALPVHQQLWHWLCRMNRSLTSTKKDFNNLHCLCWIIVKNVVIMLCIFIHAKVDSAPLELTHWGRVMHICVSRLTIITSDNGLLPGRRQAIIWTNAGILLIWPLGTNFREILIKIHTFSLMKMHFKMLPAKWQPFCLSLNEFCASSLRIMSPWWFVQHLWVQSWWQPQAPH